MEAGRPHGEGLPAETERWGHCGQEAAREGFQAGGPGRGGLKPPYPWWPKHGSGVVGEGQPGQMGLEGAFRMMVFSREKMGVLKGFVHRSVLAWPVFTGSQGGSLGMGHWGWGPWSPWEPAMQQVGTCDSRTVVQEGQWRGGASWACSDRRPPALLAACL